MSSVAPSDLNCLARKLAEHSGLSASQLGRLLGTSVRAWINYVSGSPIPPQLAPRLRHVAETILPVAGPTPSERRRLLLDSSRVPSIFRVLVEEVPPPQRLRRPVPVAERLGV